jgi:hypothetical protein
MRFQNILIALFSVLLANDLLAQTLNQDAEGNSSIVYEGGNIGFDLTKTNLAISYTNLGLLSTNAETSFWKPLWGINIYGNISEGIANIFTRGNFQPQSGLIGLLGVRHRFDPKPQELIEVENQKDSLIMERNEVRKKIDSIKGASDTLKDTTLQAKKGELACLNNHIQELQNKRKEINNGRTRSLLVLYGRIGKNAISFKLAQENPDTTALSKKFENKYYSGGFFGAGINFEYGRWLFGGAIDREYTNNFDELSKSVYVITTKETKGNQTLENKKEITAYSGNLCYYQRTNLNLDIIMFLKLDNNDRNYMALNSYIRHKISDSPGIMPTFTNIGIGAYFFNKSNKLLGGAYFEAPDIFRNMENKKSNTNDGEIQKRITIGIVAKFNFASIMGPSFK